MKWFLLLLLVTAGIAAFLTTSLDPEKFDSLAPPSAGNVAFPLVLVGIVFVIGLGVWRFYLKQ